MRHHSEFSSNIHRKKWSEEMTKKEHEIASDENKSNENTSGGKCKQENASDKWGQCK